VLIRESLAPENVEIVDGAETPEAVIRRLAEALAAKMRLDPAAIERAVMLREQARSTAFNNGAAIPHCRLPAIDRFAAALMVIHEPLQWDSQGRSVDTVMMIIGPTERVSDHLRILANSSQLLDSRSVRAKLRTAPDPQSAYALLAAAEKVIEQRRSREGMLGEIRKDEPGARTDFLAETAAQFNW
jgi:nitrogen PTS system EIIA component